jgi:hypothetical protein
MNPETERPALPDRLSTDASSPHYVAAVLEHDIGIRFNERNARTSRNTASAKAGSNWRRARHSTAAGASADHAEGKGRGLLSLSRPPVKRLARLLAVPSLTCVVVLTGFFTDAATRLAYDLETAAGRVGPADGANTRWCTAYRRVGECVGPYRVQVDRVGAIIVWCKDAGGSTVSSHSTTYHTRFVDTPQTSIIDKPAKDSVVFELERRSGRVVIAVVR